VLVLAATLVIFGAGGALAQQILVPMDLTQTNHLKAYGLAYFALAKGHQVDWLLNYKGGSFLIPDVEEIELEARLRNVSFQPVTGAEVAQIQAEIAANNMESVRLEKAPRMAIYVPPLKQPWDDAVMMALDYAQVPYTRVFDEGRACRRSCQVRLAAPCTTKISPASTASSTGHTATPTGTRPTSATPRRAPSGSASPRCPTRKKAVAEAIRTFVMNGGFLFAMCSATDTFDIALAAHDVDIVPRSSITTASRRATRTSSTTTAAFAFTDFHLITKCRDL
jgi:hypothetical protein